MSSLSLIESIVLNLPVGKIQALLADKTPEEKKDIVNARDPFGDSPLHLAAARQKEILVHILLDCGADPNAVNDAGSTPLHKAVLGGSELVVSTLLPLSKQVVNKSGLYPLDYCRRNKSLWQKLFAAHKPAFHSKMTVDQALLRHIVGQKQKHVEEIRVNSGAHLTIPKNTQNAQSGPVDIQIHAVREVDLSVAKAQVEKLIANAQKINAPPPKEAHPSNPGAVVATKETQTDYKITKTQTMPVPKDKHSKIIGKGRQNLQKIEAESGAQVTVPPPKDTSDLITIKGDAQEIAAAKKLILQLLKADGPSTTPGGFTKKITVSAEFKGLLLAREKAPGYSNSVGFGQYLGAESSKQGGDAKAGSLKIAPGKDAKKPREPLKLEKRHDVRIRIINGPSADLVDVQIDGARQNVDDAVIDILGLTTARAPREPRQPREHREREPETRTLDRTPAYDGPRPAGRGRREEKLPYETPNAAAKKPQETKVPVHTDQAAWPSMGGKK